MKLDMSENTITWKQLLLQSNEAFAIRGGSGLPISTLALCHACATHRISFRHKSDSFPTEVFSVGDGRNLIFSYFAGYENPNLPGIKSFTALPFRAYLMGDLLPGVALRFTPGYLISPLRGVGTTARHSQRMLGIHGY